MPVIEEHHLLGLSPRNNIGVRNHIIILPLDTCQRRRRGRRRQGTLAIPHPYGRLQFGPDLDRATYADRHGLERVAAVVVIIEDGWTKKVVDGIAKTGKPVVGFGIEGHGDHETIKRASMAAKQFVQHVTALHRVECPISDLWVSTKCGESDTTSGCGSNPTVGNAFDKLHPLGTTLCFGETSEITGGENIVAARCANDQVRERFMFMFDRYQDMINRWKTSDLSESQPTKGNIAGGLTTIEEKALGNIQKIGRSAPSTACSTRPRADAPGPVVHGLVSAAAEMVTLCAASGYVVHFFPTGQGNVIGNPILPVIKLCANPRTVRLMSEHVDVDCSGLLQREMTLDQTGDKLLEAMLATANGRWTAAEALGHREFVLTRIHESA